MYITPTGLKITLYYHGPKDWAAATRSRLLGLGCSVEYADKVAADIAAAELIPNP